MTPKRIAVVGGGIAGLSAVFALAEARRAGAPVAEYLLEASPRLGGALHTERIEGCLVECGADSFLTEKPDASDLARRLGLGEQLIGSSDHNRGTWILHRGRLTPLPPGFEFFLPTRLAAVLRTPLLSARDKLAIFREPFLRPRAADADESVAAFVERHFGRSLVRNVVEPLLAAVYGGDAERLSARAVLPRLVEMERRTGSLVRGLRQAWRGRSRRAKGQGSRGPLFTTLRDGLQTLAETLQSRLESARVLCGRRVLDVARSPGGYRLALAGAEPLEVDALVLALPAWESARLLAALDASLARRLEEIVYSPSVIVALGYDGGSVRLPRGFGFVVPRSEGRRLRACTFVGQKFEHRVPRGRVLLRCFLGGVADSGALDLSDDEVFEAVRRELKAIVGVSAQPLFSRVYRWPRALAQYDVGHLERVAAIQEQVERISGVWLCGNAYQGIGIPDCVRSGQEAARDCLRWLKAV